MYDNKSYEFKIGDKVGFQWSIINRCILIGTLVAKLTNNRCIVKVTQCDIDNDVLNYIRRSFGLSFNSNSLSNIALLNDIIEGNVKSLNEDGFLTKLDKLSLIEQKPLVIEDGDYNS